MGRIFNKSEKNRVWKIKGRIKIDEWWKERKNIRNKRE